MLTSDFSRKAHANFQNHILSQCVFFLHIDVKLTSISRKIEVHIESKFHFSVSIDFFFYPFQRNKHQKYNYLGVNNTTTYKLFKSREKTVPNFVTSL